MTAVVAVFNMKGGVGKTTVSAHLVHTLAYTRKKRILVLDLDPQFNLTQLLLEEKAYEALRTDHKTVMRVFQPKDRASLFDVVDTPIPPPPVREVATTLDHGKDWTYDLIAGDMDLVRFGILKETDALPSVQARFQRFIGEAKEHYDGIFLDCNPSGSFLTACALRAATRLLVPVRPDRYSYLGLRHVAKLLGMFPEIYPKPHLDIVMNGEARSDPKSQVETEIRATEDYGRALLAAKLFKSKHLEARPESLGFAADARGPWSNEIREELKDLATEYGSRRLSWA